ncbi:Hypothetical predicted protein [Pelobates cultripes]|uniref:Reverse transcriptase zinc-binding domain-containing protein n=1 Tax=Pelobates cultripes TaxID=61616 RepID=A0AAD1SGQ3_PELCU|nr:Hypothetical predicted protein [Pelobates cultripes]
MLPTTKLMLSIWDKNKHRVCSRYKWSPATPLKTLHTLDPSFNYKIWAEHDITHLHQLTQDGSLRSFKELQTHHNIPNRAQFSYMQLHHTLQTIDTPTQPVTGEPNLTHFETKCLDKKKQNKTISLCYNLLIGKPQTHLWGFQKEWHTDIGRELTPQEWGRAFLAHKSATRCASHLEIARKLLYRWHLTPSKLNKMYNNSEAKCWRCLKAKGDTLHIWWTCPLIRPVWEAVEEIVTNSTGVMIQPSIEIYLLHISPQNITKSVRKLVYLITIAASTLIARQWKSPEIPTKTEIIALASTNVSYEKFAGTLGQEDRTTTEAYNMWLQYEQATHITHRHTTHDPP